ncbi:MAG: YjgN family protein [Nitrospirales bacterium]
MDTVTEVTCPECGEVQATAEECMSCGASLIRPDEDIPIMEGKKIVSSPWPTKTESTSAAPTSTTTAESALNDPFPFPEPQPDSEKSSSISEKNATAIEQPSVTTNLQPTEIHDEEQITEVHAETRTPQPHVALPWQAISNSQELEIQESSPTNVPSPTVKPSDSSNVEQQVNVEPPIPEPIANETAASPDRVRHLHFWGNGKSLFGIFIVNTFLTLITLGIYSFWGRTRVRQFLNSQTSFAAARFFYHGTGKELFTGWIKAMLVFGLPYITLSALPYLWHGIPTYIPQVIAGLLFLAFIPVAVVGAHRYRLSRTSLSNIRFSFRGTVSEYTKIWLKGSVLTLLTLGIYYPFFENTRRQYLVTHSQFGSQTFEYDGQGKELLTIYSKATGLYLATILLLGGITLASITSYFSMSVSDMKTILFASSSLPIILIVGLSVPWFYLQAARQRFFWNHTKFGDARFNSTVTAWKIFELRLGHFVLLMSTLGLTWPWVQIRNLQFLYFYTSLRGPLNLHRVEQDALDASPTGEELAGFFDTGFDLG